MAWSVKSRVSSRSLGFVKRAGLDNSTKADRGSSGEGSGGSGSGNDGTNGNGSYNSCNYTYSDSSGNTNESDGASSSGNNVTSLVLGSVTSRQSTVVGGWARDGNLETTLNDIANGIVARILSGTVDWSVNARERYVGGVNIASINGTVVVVVTEVHR